MIFFPLKTLFEYNINGMDKKIKIIVISDNHGFLDPVTKILERYPDADYFFHLGDSELPKQLLKGYACVRGNTDYDPDLPLRLRLTIGGHHILLTHGHRDLFMGSMEGLVQRAKEADCDIVCFGHTHVYTDKVLRGVRLLNPGSIWHCRDGSAPCYMILELDEDSVQARRVDFAY